jgi:uncharacterized protein YbjT (DUF2867 family)
MVATNGRTVTVFGGTGFLGRRIVRHLRYRGFPVRIASRHPDRGQRQFGPVDPQIQSVEANIHDERSVADAFAGAYAAVNVVSLYVEHGQENFSFRSRRVCPTGNSSSGVERLVHVSGIGADAASPSRYIQKRGEGELAVRTAFVDALFVRPAVMFGPDDAFLTAILKLLRQLPVYPMFGRGRTRLQPAYVEDVAEAIARIMQRDGTPSMIFEFGGPRVYSYEEAANPPLPERPDAPSAVTQFRKALSLRTKRPPVPRGIVRSIAPDAIDQEAQAKLLTVMLPGAGRRTRHRADGESSRAWAAADENKAPASLATPRNQVLSHK